MAKIDKVKAQIDFLKFLVGFMVTTIIGVCGWALTTKVNLFEDTTLYVFSALFLTSLILLTIILLIAIYRKINDLEEL